MSAGSMKSWWVGGWGADQDGEALGITLLTSRPDGSLGDPTLAVATESPSMLAVDGDALLVASEGRGTVDVFVPVPGGLTLASSAPAGGRSTCSIARWGSLVLAANYTDGTIGVIEDGELIQVLEGQGSGPRPQQRSAHAHAVFPVDDSAMLSLDLGSDQIHVHGREGSRVVRRASVSVPPGSGPRDIIRHPSGALYVLGELGGELFVFDWIDGMPVAASSAPVPGAEPGDHGSAIAFGEGGRFVYTALRGSNRIAVLEASEDGRELTAVGWVSCAGDWPRHLVVDGDLLHVANQLSHEVATFRLGGDGIPVLVAPPVRVLSPTYLVPVP